MTIIAPSILSADFTRLAEQITLVENAGADWLHVDVMDGHFVPNITVGPVVLKNLSKITRLKLDVHLMIQDPDRYLEAFIALGAHMLTVHVEAVTHLHRTVSKIKELGAKAGVSLNPATSLSTLDYILPDLDMVLLMSVNPGFGGQKFIPHVLDKINALKQKISALGANCLIQVDGGVNLTNAPEIVAAGADVLVAGAAVYEAPDPAAVIGQLKRLR